AKVVHWLPTSKQERSPFSMSSVKTMYHNQLLRYRFFNVFGISPNKQKNQTKIKEILQYGTIAA
ncbi:MAG: hypothetical protein ACJA2S_005723, partial [Cyclobacteriaceae bacterium]